MVILLLDNPDSPDITCLLWEVLLGWPSEEKRLVYRAKERGSELEEANLLEPRNADANTCPLKPL